MTEVGWRATRGRRGLLFVVSAPSGTGKTSLCSKLIRRVRDLQFSISYTTRPPRAREVNGVDYRFIDRTTFTNMIERHEFLEWAQVYGHFYGTHAETVTRTLANGTDLLLDVDAQGAMNIKKIYHDGVFIFLLPPSFETLRTRLYERGLDSPEEIGRRLEQAREEISYFREYTYLSVNEEFDQTLKELEAIIAAERLKTAYVDDAWIDERFPIHAKGV